jgi:hypothetical protein
MRLLTALFISFALFGCSNAPAVLASVTGAVRLDGLPLKEGVIIFEGDDAPPAYGKIIDGQIVEVTTHQPNDGMSLGPKWSQCVPTKGTRFYQVLFSLRCSPLASITRSFPTVIGTRPQVIFLVELSTAQITCCSRWLQNIKVRFRQNNADWPKLGAESRTMSACARCFRTRP